MKTVSNYKITGELGQGIFLIKDVSEILGLPYSKVRRWLNEFWDNRFSSNRSKYSFGDDGNRAVNFYTLIEFLAFYKFREHGVSAQQIQKSHQAMAKDLNTKFPFAKRDMFTDGRNIYYSQDGNIIKANNKRQYEIEKLLRKYLRNIEFDENEIARRYFPLGKTRSVVVDPHHQFGRPTILGTNIKIETIHNLLENGEPKRKVCSLFDLTSDQVNDVIYYYRKLAA